MVYHEQLITVEETVTREKYLKTGSGREWLKKEVAHE